MKLLVLIFIVHMSFFANCQLVQFDSSHRTAKIHLNSMWKGFTYVIGSTDKVPATGMYSPSLYTLMGVKSGVGLCSYVYLETSELLKPGKQYSLTAKISVDSSYYSSPYFQQHFGFALSANLPKNKWGLLPKQFIPVGLIDDTAIVDVEFEFRPLCKSKYLMLGIFQGQEMDDQRCNVCQYYFKLHELNVRESGNSNNKFHYICDAFEEEKLSKWNTDCSTDTILFESGSDFISPEYSSLLDSIPLKLNTSQDLVSLYSYTDSQGEGNDNDLLSVRRNEVVRNELIRRGIDSSRITLTNYGESNASSNLLNSDRRVEIDVNIGKLHQLYYEEGLKAATNGDYGLVHKIMTDKWLRTVPPELALNVIFDCWGNNKKADRFISHIKKKIEKKFYKGQSTTFLLDSVYIEIMLLKNSTEKLFHLNRLPSHPFTCSENRKSTTKISLQKFSEEFYDEYGFLTKEEVGQKGNNAIPEIILLNDDLDYLKKFLPLLKTACEQEILHWQYYAKLYDKISEIETGFQKYGTNIVRRESGRLTTETPILDLGKVNEYRKQTKLSLFSKFELESLRYSQN